MKAETILDNVAVALARSASLALETLEAVRVVEGVFDRAGLGAFAHRLNDSRFEKIAAAATLLEEAATTALDAAPWAKGANLGDVDPVEDVDPVVEGESDPTVSASAGLEILRRRLLAGPLFFNVGDDVGLVPDLSYLVAGEPDAFGRVVSDRDQWREEATKRIQDIAETATRAASYLDDVDPTDFDSARDAIGAVIQAKRKAGDDAEALADFQTRAIIAQVEDVGDARAVADALAAAVVTMKEDERRVACEAIVSRFTPSAMPPDDRDLFRLGTDPKPSRIAKVVDVDVALSGLEQPRYIDLLLVADGVECIRIEEDEIFAHEKKVAREDAGIILDALLEWSRAMQRESNKADDDATTKGEA